MASCQFPSCQGRKKQWNDFARESSSVLPSGGSRRFGLDNAGGFLKTLLRRDFLFSGCMVCLSVVFQTVILL